MIMMLNDKTLPYKRFYGIINTKIYVILWYNQLILALRYQSQGHQGIFLGKKNPLKIDNFSCNWFKSSAMHQNRSIRRVLAPFS